MRTINNFDYTLIANALREEIDGYDTWTGEIPFEEYNLKIACDMTWGKVIAPDFEGKQLQDITCIHCELIYYNETGQLEDTDFDFETLKSYIHE